MPFRQLELDALYEIGWCHFRENRFQDAAECFEDFLRSSPIKAFRCYCAWQLGVALDMLGRHDSAAQWMARVKGFQRKEYSFDSYAVRKAAEYLLPSPRPLDAMQRRLVLLSNLSKNSLLSESSAAQLIGECEADLSAPSGGFCAHHSRHEYLVELLYLKSAITKTLEPAAHEKYVQQVNDTLALAPHVKRERYLLVQALVDLAEFYLATGPRVALAKTALNQGRTVMKGNCDFEKPLSRKLHALTDQISELESNS